MEFDAFAEAAVWLLPPALFFVLGLAGAAASGTMSIVGRRTPAPLGALGIGVLCLGTLATTLVANGMASSAPEGEAWLLLAGGAMVRFVMWFGALFIGGISLLLLAIAGLRKRPHSPRWALYGLAAGLVVGALAIAASTVPESPVFWLTRGATYVLGALFLAVAMAGRGEEGSFHSENGAGAALVFGLMVAASEASARAMATIFMLQHAVQLEPGLREQAISLFLKTQQVELVWQHGVVAGATVAGLVGVFSAVRAGRRVSLLGLLWVFVMWAVWLLGEPSEALLVSAVMAMP